MNATTQISYLESGTLYDGVLFVSQDGLTAVLRREGANAPYYNPLYWDAIAAKWVEFNGWRSWNSMERAIAEFSNSPEKAVSIPRGYMVGSTGDLVLADDWDEFEAGL